MTEQAVFAAEEAAHGRTAEYSEAGLNEMFAGQVRRHDELKRAEAKLKELQRDCNDRIRTMLDAAKVKSVTVDHRWKATVCEGRAGSKRIDPIKLMDLGVTSDVIQKATTQGERGAPYLLVTELDRNGRREE